MDTQRQCPDDLVAKVDRMAADMEVLKALVAGLQPPALGAGNSDSDGAGSQYKNCKILVNLSDHESDFGVKAEWHFFATSHESPLCHWCHCEAPGCTSQSAGNR